MPKQAAHKSAPIKSFILRMPQETFFKLKKKAEQKDLSINAYVLELLKKGILR